MNKTQEIEEKETRVMTISCTINMNEILFVKAIILITNT